MTGEQLSRDSIRVYTPVWRGRKIEPCSHASGTSEAGLTPLFRRLLSINTDGRHRRPRLLL